MMLWWWTYFITGTDLRVKDIKVDARGISAELETKASDLGDAMPYIVHDGDTILHGMVNTKRFMADWQLLQQEASKKGRFANVAQAAAAQCFRELNQTAYPDAAPVVDVLDARIKGNKAIFTVLFVSDPEMVPENVCHERQIDPAKYHYHLPSSCASVATTLEWVQAILDAGESNADALGAFALTVKT
ncbi:hypothetical protein COHA_008652 [Chlorella ohadii]|uniref:Uncharacterized protein n=1 Tax=Chlorella ohadii TaxID=2649997 RepID=A0AAD5GYL2_9CHLO|nr:hypothetical protein COHA_008652 [Chlorella ohadii]